MRRGGPRRTRVKRQSGGRHGELSGGGVALELDAVDVDSAFGNGAVPISLGELDLYGFGTAALGILSYDPRISGERSVQTWSLGMVAPVGPQLATFLQVLPSGMP
jgi:hypothetical protein